MTELTAPPSVRRLVATAAEHHGVTVADILGPSRRAPVVLARQEAYASIYDLGWPSLRQIGHWLGREHCPVLLGIRRHNERMRAAA